ncbi:hypothetical protein BYT27DRAFT_7181309 [Phlegmacium glaucopus]|nr:hypothetical protein BYT27DRAFT_7181309 [Phlegmacium glaucopus]
MKIIKHRFHIPGRRPLAIQTQLPPPPLKKKALLFGIQRVREDGNEMTQKNDETTNEDREAKAKAVPKRKKQKKREDRDNERAHKDSVLKGPHRDVLDMQQLLIDVYHYDPKDITILIDDDNPDHMQPTRENMIKKMFELVDGARPGDRFFFHFSGHALQQDTKNPDEEDGKDEFILSSDGKVIQDDELRILLVQPLPIGSTLVAIFDSCHSASLLDLEHFRCNRVYVPWLNKGRRKTDFLRNVVMRHNAKIDVSLRSVTQATRLSRSAITWKRTSIDQVLASPLMPSTFDLTQMSPITTKTKKSLSISTTIGDESWYGSAGSPIARCGSPESMFCTGRCRDDPILQESFMPSADVISLSSSKDGQRSWEGPKGSSMTQALIKVLRNDPNPTLKDLLTLVSHDIHLFYLTLHEKAREYKKQVKIFNTKKTREGEEPRKAKSVEMTNFQDPQISSPQPLDMNRRWHI